MKNLIILLGLFFVFTAFVSCGVNDAPPKEVSITLDEMKNGFEIETLYLDPHLPPIAPFPLPLPPSEPDSVKLWGYYLSPPYSRLKIWEVGEKVLKYELEVVFTEKTKEEDVIDRVSLAINKVLSDKNKSKMFTYEVLDAYSESLEYYKSIERCNGDLEIRSIPSLDMVRIRWVSNDYLYISSKKKEDY